MNLLNKYIFANTDKYLLKTLLLMMTLLIAALPSTFFLKPLDAQNNLRILNRETKAPLIIPLNGKISVHFRQSYFDIKENVTRKHTGVDIEGYIGSNVIASGNGIVSYIGFSPIGGRTIVIKHNEKLRTTYLNLLQILAAPGQSVNQGDIIATIGANDDPSSEIPHLHFGIIYDNYYLDPEDIFKINYRSISKYISLKNIKPDFSIEILEN